jgi:hypothetical protein
MLVVKPCTTQLFDEYLTSTVTFEWYPRLNLKSTGPLPALGSRFKSILLDSQYVSANP